jgi:hypothetical protein
MPRFTIQQEGNTQFFHDKGSQYTLIVGCEIIEGKTVVGEGNVHFSGPINCRPVPRYWGITARDRSSYDVLPEQFENQQIVEVAAGVGEFIPDYVRRFSASSSFIPPTVIDPADHSAMAGLLRYAQDHAPEYAMPRVKELYERCCIILSDKVRLFHMTIEQAIDEHPELYGRFDAVIENAGPSMIKTNGYADLIQSLERKLLQPRGRLFVS